MPFFSYKCEHCGKEKKVFQSPGDKRPVICECGNETKKQYESFYAFDSQNKSRKNIEKAVEQNKESLKEYKKELIKDSNKEVK